PASAQKLRAFYERVLGTAGRPLDVGAGGLRPAVARNGSAPRRLGYATVRDYCDSVERLPLLATANRDLKDVQRPWALKTIAATVERGSRLLEIGAGEPVVAAMLARLGYDVTVVDPYDGRDGGPTGFDAMAADYPNVRIVRGVFPDDVADEGSFDCVYS